jgi:hypothetical protein
MDQSLVRIATRSYIQGVVTCEMPYELRPGNKLKRPVRLLSLGEDDYDLGTNSQIEFTAHGTASIDNASSRVDGLSARDSPFIHPSPSSHLEPLTRLTSPFQSHSPKRLRQPHTMARVKYFGPYRGHLDTRGERNDDAAPVVRTTERPARRTFELIEPEEPALYRHLPPAAFPSLFLGGSRPVGGPAPLEGYSKHRLMQILEARKKCDRAALTRYLEQARLMWANKGFPEYIDAEQRKWYSQVQDCRRVQGAGTELKAYAGVEEAMRENYDVSVSRIEVQAFTRRTTDPQTAT